MLSSRLWRGHREATGMPGRDGSRRRSAAAGVFTQASATQFREDAGSGTGNGCLPGLTLHHACAFEGILAPNSPADPVLRE
jgi:hypothetical protein